MGDVGKGIGKGVKEPAVVGGEGCQRGCGREVS